MSGFVKIFRRITSVLARKQFVGQDSNGNLYYKKTETDFSGNILERRLMVPGGRGNHITYDPKTVPPQWRQWLSKTRDDPPSEDELNRETDRLAQLQARVLELRADEQRRRMQADSMEEETQAAHGPSLDRFLGQLSNRGYNVDSTGSSNRNSSQGEDSGKSKSAKKEFEPETWQPGA